MKSEIDLRQLRMDRGLTIEQVALKSGVSQATVRQLELGLGGFTAMTKNKICGVLGIPLSQAFPEDYREIVEIVNANETMEKKKKGGKG